MSIPASPPDPPQTSPDPAPPPFYLKPEAECDLVMKGGITSGLVYPPAILKLAEKFRFRGIGGASAGAIGAAAAAAAELGRATGGFDRLALLQKDLASPRFMLKLFQPSPRTRPLFDTILALKPFFDAGAAASSAATDARSAANAAKHAEAIAATLAAAGADSKNGAAAALATAHTKAASEAARAARKCASDAARQAEVAALARDHALAADNAFAAGVESDAERAASAATGAAALVAAAAGAARAARNEATVEAARAGVLAPPAPADPGPGEPSRAWLSWARRLDRTFAHTLPAARRQGQVVGAVAGAVAALVFRPPLLRGEATLFSLAGAVLLILVGVWLGGFVAAGFELVEAYRSLSSKEDGFFGFCTGSNGAAAQAPTPEEGAPLTDWLHAGINDLVGTGFDDPPVTIRDLAENKVRLDDGTDKVLPISFQMVTTNLSQARPCQFPTDRRELVFAEADFARFFPPSVMAYLVAGPARPANKPPDRGSADEISVLPPGFHFLPSGGDLPVVVATRLSLSFPVLLSALRLYSIKGSSFEAAREYARATKEPYPLDAKRDLEENWFSDGGIAANFPLSIFDAWVPGRATFGIDLADAPLADRVPRPTQNDDVILPRAQDTDDPRARPAPIPGLVKLFLAMLDTARNARDNAQAGMASYRERVVQVYLAPDEGGLNLTMGTAAVDRIVDKGTRAAAKLVGDFSFDAHLWVRTLLLMSHLEQEFARVQLAYGAPDGSLAPLRQRYVDLFAEQVQAKGAARFYRPQTQAWCDEATLRIEGLIALMDTWRERQPLWAAANPEAIEENRHLKDEFFHADPPAPDGALRVTTPI